MLTNGAPLIDLDLKDVAEEPGLRIRWAALYAVLRAAAASATVYDRAFEELEPLRGLTSYNAARRYPAYVTFLYGLAHELSVPAENLEFFLFEFGLHLKPVAPQQNLGVA